MCGIVGYIGKRKEYPILIKGLHRLLRRGILRHHERTRPSNRKTRVLPCDAQQPERCDHRARNHT